MLYSFFRVISRLLNFSCRRFRTLFSIFVGGVSILPANTAYEIGTVSRNVGTKFRRQGITQKKEYNNQWCFTQRYPVSYSD